MSCTTLSRHLIVPQYEGKSDQGKFGGEFYPFQALIPVLGRYTTKHGSGKWAIFTHFSGGITASERWIAEPKCNKNNIRGERFCPHHSTFTPSNKYGKELLAEWWHGCRSSINYDQRKQKHEFKRVQQLQLPKTLNAEVPWIIFTNNNLLATWGLVKFRNIVGDVSMRFWQASAYFS